MPAHRLVGMGIAHAPEGRRIFGTLTVQENLNPGCVYPSRSDPNRQNPCNGFTNCFPVLAQRREQLAGFPERRRTANAGHRPGADGQPDLLLDEPSLGLAPLLVKVIFQTPVGDQRAGSPSCWSSKMPAPR